MGRTRWPWASISRFMRRCLNILATGNTPNDYAKPAKSWIFTFVKSGIRCGAGDREEGQEAVAASTRPQEPRGRPRESQTSKTHARMLRTATTRPQIIPQSRNHFFPGLPRICLQFQDPGHVTEPSAGPGDYTNIHQQRIRPPTRDRAVCGPWRLHEHSSAAHTPANT